MRPPTHTRGCPPFLAAPLWSVGWLHATAASPRQLAVTLWSPKPPAAPQCVQPDPADLDCSSGPHTQRQGLCGRVPALHVGPAQPRRLGMHLRWVLPEHGGLGSGQEQERADFSLPHKGVHSIFRGLAHNNPRPSLVAVPDDLLCAGPGLAGRAGGGPTNPPSQGCVRPGSRRPGLPQASAPSFTVKGDPDGL